MEVFVLPQVSQDVKKLKLSCSKATSQRSTGATPSTAEARFQRIQDILLGKSSSEDLTLVQQALAKEGKSVKVFVENHVNQLLVSNGKEALGLCVALYPSLLVHREILAGRMPPAQAHRHTYPPYPCCPDESDWPVMLVELALERQNLIYMMKVIVPQIILTAVAFSTFWLSPACGERLGLAVTVPLAVAVYDLLTFSQLPVSNKVTLVSALGMTAFLFSMAVLLENAFVIQLWHYSEHTYFKGASVLAATAVAYREQLVWVQLLGCIHQLKFEVARRQLSMLESSRRSTTPKSPRDKSLHGCSAKSLTSLTRWHEAVTQTHQSSKTLTRLPTPPASRDNRDKMLCTELSLQQPGAHRGLNGVPSGTISSCCSKDTADVADDASLEACGDVLSGQQDAERPAAGTAAATAAWRRNSSGKSSAGGAAAAAADAADAGTVDGAKCQAASADSTTPKSPGWPVLGRARKQVFVQLGELEAQLGVGEGKDATTDALLLSCTTKEQLRAHLNNILTSRDKGLASIQRRIQKAFVVFGEDLVCSRLHAVLAGDAGAKQAGPGSPHGLASDADQPPAVSAAEASEVSPHSLQSRLNSEFNRRWQLLSMMIDHVCRYLFIFAYVGSMVAIIVALLNSDDT